MEWRKGEFSVPSLDRKEEWKKHHVEGRKWKKEENGSGMPMLYLDREKEGLSLGRRSWERQKAVRRERKVSLNPLKEKKVVLKNRPSHSLSHLNYSEKRASFFPFPYRAGRMVEGGRSRKKRGDIQLELLLWSSFFFLGGKVQQKRKKKEGK